MMKSIRLLPIVCLLFIAGCATPSAEEFANADFGYYPDNYESIIRNHLRGSLKDPDSAQIEFLNEPKKGWFGMGASKYGYVVCAQINAKNSFGAYVGYRPAYFRIRNGLVVDATVGDGSYGDSMANGKCSHFI